jgi:hypothetical protein
VSVNVCLLVFTDGRKECLQRTLESAEHALVEQNPGLIRWRFIINDAANKPDYSAWLAKNYADRYVIVDHQVKRGFCGAVESGWSFIPAAADYVFHLEDDFVFMRPAFLDRMIAVLDAHPELVQLVLKRQPWNEAEKAAGGIIERDPDSFHEVTDGSDIWTEHNAFFSTNPSLYRASLPLEVPWPQAPECEGRFTFAIRSQIPNARFAFWGAKFDSPWVSHIGTKRVGNGY